VTSGLPLPTLLSPALVAFTIEFDNEVEHRLAHKTTVAGPSEPANRGPWLTSQVMWSNVLQYLDDDGICVGELQARARTKRISLAGLRRWGYLSLDATGTPGQDDVVVHLTAAGRQAREIWRPLAGEIEDRWRARFGADAIDDLRSALGDIRRHIDLDLPRYLPIVFPSANGMAETFGLLDPATPAGDEDDPDLSVLLSQVLLAFTVDFEGPSRIALPTSANTLRVLTGSALRLRDLPPLTGVSKEANHMCVAWLERHGYATVEPDPSASRGKVVRLTVKGQKAQDKYRRILDDTESGWQLRFGREPMARLRRALEQVVGEGLTRDESPLFQGLEPYPDGWRASVRPATTLPHYPMVLHRGGYPDGS
jgi:DNA-binding MarR family transcriptional regulator